ncbi:MAG TPA: hypothetical protein DCX03_07510 [Bacteroidales bacterium]|nr:hypothetical protein [Bacteroidales bacterium]
MLSLLGDSMNMDEDKENDDIEIGEPISKDLEDDIELPSEGELIDFKRSRDIKRTNKDPANNAVSGNNLIKVDKQLRHLSRKMDMANRLLVGLIAAMILLLLVMFILSMQIKDISHRIDHDNVTLNDINKSLMDMNRANSQKVSSFHFEPFRNESIFPKFTGISRNISISNSSSRIINPF